MDSHHDPDAGDGRHQEPDQAPVRAATLTRVLPNAQRRTLAGLDHSAVVRSPNALAPVLVEFLTARSAARS